MSSRPSLPSDQHSKLLASIRSHGNELGSKGAGANSATQETLKKAEKKSINDSDKLRKACSAGANYAHALAATAEQLKPQVANSANSFGGGNIDSK